MNSSQCWEVGRQIEDGVMQEEQVAAAEEKMGQVQVL